MARTFKTVKSNKQINVMLKLDYTNRETYVLRKIYNGEWAIMVNIRGQRMQDRVPLIRSRCMAL